MSTFNWPRDNAELVAQLQKQRRRYEQLVKKEINSPLTSSCGRLFDAVSAILGLCSVPAYDAQGAILLEQEAKRCETVPEAYPFSIDEGNTVRFDEMIRTNHVFVKRRFSGNYTGEKIMIDMSHITE